MPQPVATMPAEQGERERHVPGGNAYGWHRKNDADPAGNMPGQRPAMQHHNPEGEQGYEREGFNGRAFLGGPSGPSDVDPAILAEVIRRRRMQHMAMANDGGAFRQGGAPMMQDWRGSGGGSPYQRPVSLGGFPADAYTSGPSGGMVSVNGGGYQADPSGGMQYQTGGGFQAPPSGGFYARPFRQPSMYDLISYPRDGA